MVNSGNRSSARREGTKLLFYRESDGSPAKLDVPKLRKLINSCLDTTQQLLEGAEILYNNRSYSTSTLLSVLALEELGKRKILGEYVWAKDNHKEEIKFWKRFRDHKEKISRALEPSSRIGVENKGEAKTDYISLWFEEHEELKIGAGLIDQLKQLVTYTNISEGEILNPSRLPIRQSKRVAFALLGMVKMILEYHKRLEPTEKIVEDYKSINKKRRKGETPLEYWYRTHPARK